MYIDAEIKSIAEDGSVIVSSLCNSSCEGCKGGLFCKQKNSSFDACDKTNKAKIGDKVRVYLPKNKTILSSLLLFLFPLLFMLIFLILGQVHIISEFLSGILSIVGLLTGFLIVFLINKHNKKKLLAEVVEVYES